MLNNIRVLDLSRAIAGPYCTMLLGDFGADVIKLEPLGGDVARGAGLSRAGGQATYFLAMNRNKRSIAVDVKSPAGKEILAKLIARSDVLVENFRAGVMDRLGFDEAKLKALNPNLLVCSISGYGQESLYRDRKGLDLIGQTMSGIASLTGEANGPPTPAGAPISDILTGLNACIGVLVGLMGRASGETGLGQVDVSLLSSSLSAVTVEATSFLNTGKIPGRFGSAWFEIFPYDVFQTSDGWIAIGAAAEWQKLCRLLGLDDLADREDLLDMEVRLSQRHELKERMTVATKQFTTAALVEKLQDSDLLCGPVYDMQQVFADPAVAASGLRIEMEQSEYGRFATVDSGPSLNRGGRRQEKPKRPPPLLGEHTREILAELGYVADEIEHACRDNAVVSRSN